MKKITAAITGVHGYAPEDILSNAMLEKMVETNNEWIVSRTGIEERRILKGEGLGSSDMAKHAVNGLLEKTNTNPKDIDLIICATVTPDFLFPSTANMTASKCGMENIPGFDINAACSGFLYALNTGSKFIESGTYKKVIVIGADKMSSIVNYEDRSTCILFGDAAGAVLLEPNEEEFGVIDCIMGGDTVGVEYLNQKAGGSVKPASHETVDAKEHFIFQDGGPVFKMAVSKMAEVSKEVMSRNNLNGEDVAWLVPHQANKRIIDATARFADIPQEKVMLNIGKYGNTTAATIPLCLWEWEKKLNKGDNLILAAFGGGFTWGSLYLKWAY